MAASPPAGLCTADTIPSSGARARRRSEHRLLPQPRALDADEVLLIEALPPACEYWNFQLNNHWMESLDYRYHTIHTNKHLATCEADGAIRLIVAHQDPGLPNWIETAGYTSGTMCFRWVRADTHPEPRTSVVRVRDLDAFRGRA